MNRLLDLSREVVAKRIAVVSGVTTVLTLLVGFGVITPEVSAQTVGFIGAVLALLAGLVGTKVVRSQVTPTKDPRDNDGNQLISMPVHLAAMDAVRSDTLAETAAAHDPDQPSAGTPPVVAGVDLNSLSWPGQVHTPEHAAPDTEEH